MNMLNHLVLSNEIKLVASMNSVEEDIHIELNKGSIPT
jgi:hypothetical protein